MRKRLPAIALVCFGLVTSSLAADAWTAKQKPFRIHGNAYYVGSQGLSAVLVTSDEGHILIDGALPTSVPLIVESIRELGFKPEDIRYIVNSHVHQDHAGGIPGLQKLSNATVVASAWSAAAFRNGGSDEADPQYSPIRQFEPVANVRVIDDGGTLKVGSTELTARFTPGHTPGGTTWTWRSCEGARCVDVVYADSLNAVGSNAYRFSDPVSIGYFEKSFAVFERLPCDIIVSAHPEASGLWDKLAKHDRGDANAFIDPEGCRNYTVAPKQRWQQRLERERNGNVAPNG